MLHCRAMAARARVAFLAAVAVCGASPAPAAPDAGSAEARLRDVLTWSGREALREVISGRVVSLRRVMPRADGAVVPGGRGVFGLGWRVDAGRVLTAVSLIAGWPETAGDRIEIGAGGTWYLAGVGLADDALGLAVLDVPGLPAPAQKAAPPASDALWPGRPVYAVDAPGGRLLRSVITARGEGVDAYYWRALGDPLPVGAPVFGADGSLVALVGRDPGAERTSALLLPPRALRGVFEREAEWRP